MGQILLVKSRMTEILLVKRFATQLVAFDSVEIQRRDYAADEGGEPAFFAGGTIGLGAFSARILAGVFKSQFRVAGCRIVHESASVGCGVALLIQRPRRPEAFGLALI